MKTAPLALVALVAAGLCASSIQPALQAAEQPKTAPSYKQTVKVDPNYESSPEKKFRERRQKEAQVAAKRRAEARAARVLRQYIVPTRSHSRRRVPYIPLLGTALLTGAGAIIGHQSHHAWQGAAAGAVVGGLLDTWLYQQSRRTPD